MVKGAACRIERHLLDSAMASGAADAVGDVERCDRNRRSPEGYERGSSASGRSRTRLGANRCQHLRISPDLRVTGHACFRRRDPGKSSLLDGGVAIAAVDPKLARMVGMAERNGLLARNVLLSHVSRALDLIPDTQADYRQDRKPDENDTSNGVRAWLEDLHYGEEWVWTRMAKPSYRVDRRSFRPDRRKVSSSP